MKTFNDLRNDLKHSDPALYFTLEITGKLMAARDRKGISLTELSRLSGVALELLSDIEDGFAVPEFENLCMLANALNMKLTVADDN